MLGTDPVAARLGQVIQAMEKAVGINVVLEPTEFVTSLNRADAGKFDDVRGRLVGPRRPGRQHLRLRRTRPARRTTAATRTPTLDYVR